MPIKVERFVDQGVGERIALKEGRSWNTLTDQESRDLIAALQEVTPLYEHDCDKCKYLGRYTETWANTQAVPCDLYYCEREGFHTTVIARFSSEGRDYAVACQH